MNDDLFFYQLARSNKVREYAALALTRTDTLTADFEDWEVEHAWWLEGQS